MWIWAVLVRYSRKPCRRASDTTACGRDASRSSRAPCLYGSVSGSDTYCTTMVSSKTVPRSYPWSRGARFIINHSKHSASSIVRPLGGEAKGGSCPSRTAASPLSCRLQDQVVRYTLLRLSRRPIVLSFEIWESFDQGCSCMRRKHPV